MEKAKLFYECIMCGTPFDIEIDAGNFKCASKDADGRGECLYEYKSNTYCCGNEIEIRIHVWSSQGGGLIRHEITDKGLVNLRTENFENILNEVCRQMGSLMFA